MKRFALKGFTLIELLIVVAIIAILAAIAVPNFLEAQTRSKISRVKADMRTVTTALEAYVIDANHYPNMVDQHFPQNSATSTTMFHARTPTTLTTPIAYLTSLPLDVFADKASTFSNASYPASSDVGKRFAYFSWEQFLKEAPTNANYILHNKDAGRWLMYSYGPDRDVNNGGAGTYINYDPTNGTVSNGNIFRTQRTSELYTAG